MLVCARCAGIYLGALITGLLFLFNRIPELKIKIFSHCINAITT